MDVRTKIPFFPPGPEQPGAGPRKVDFYRFCPDFKGLPEKIAFGGVSAPPPINNNFNFCKQKNKE